ncbi:MAG: hypothetical protein UU47_C0022G0004 [candidate division TM6 bacterium GW2011_GWE2_41_16]|nr:MAG: hypothetical protein UU47_C0022G0004 [candidate division TM6 bacterium GW2011_GWE2_41_16]
MEQQNPQPFFDPEKALCSQMAHVNLCGQKLSEAGPSIPAVLSVQPIDMLTNALAVLSFGHIHAISAYVLLNKDNSLLTLDCHDLGEQFYRVIGMLFYEINMQDTCVWELNLVGIKGDSCDFLISLLTTMYRSIQKNIFVRLKLDDVGKTLTILKKREDPFYHITEISSHGAHSFDVSSNVLVNG